MTFELLMELLSGSLGPKPASEYRLPPGRCSCHEPTVKWCTRHGDPHHSRPMRTATATAQGANAAETTSNAASSSS